MTSGRFQGRRDGRPAGFSLLEVVIAGTILILILGVAASTIAGGQGLLRATSLQSSGDVLAQTLATQIADKIRNGAIAEVEDGNSDPLADGSTCTNGIRMRLIKSFKGGIELGKTVWIEVVRDESNVADGIDNDNDGVWDERLIRVKEFPVVSLLIDGDDDAPGAVPTDGGTMATNLGIISIVTPVASAGIDLTGILDPTDTSTTKRVDPPLSITRTGSTLTITVGVLRRDPQLLDRNRKPVLRCFRATTSVTLKN